MEKTMNEDWKTKLKAMLGFVVKGAKWYVKARYGVDVDEILKEERENEQILNRIKDRAPA